MAALPTALRADGAVPTPTGVLIGITPTDPTFAIELQNAPDNGSGSANAGAAVTITKLPPAPLSGVKYADLRSADGTFQFYRWRHVGDGYDPGTWTGWARAKATVLPAGTTDTSMYPVRRDQMMVDGLYALRATASDGSTSVSDALNTQGSVPPATSDASPFSYSSWCVSVGTRGGLHWTWSAFTIYRADGSTISVPASSSLSATAAPTLSQVAGGALAARTRCARIALVKDKMMFGISPESTMAVSANNLLKVTSPASVAGYDGWIPLIGDVNLNNETVQTATFPPATPINFGTDWTEPTGGAIIPTGSNSQYNDDATALAAHDWNLAAGTTYQYYPCWDVANARVSFAGGGGMTAKSNLQAARQNRDGYISLAAIGPTNAATPSIGAGGSGTGGGGCLHPDTVVETPAGYRRLASLTVGDRLRGRSGAWTAITKDERHPQRDWIRVRVAGGESLLTTLTHPFTLFNGIKRAVDLTLSDLVFVPGGCAEIAGLERLTLEGIEQIDVECWPEREFWAGETDPTILTHNTYVQS